MNKLLEKYKKLGFNVKTNKANKYDVYFEGSLIGTNLDHNMLKEMYDKATEGYGKNINKR